PHSPLLISNIFPSNAAHFGHAEGSAIHSYFLISYCLATSRNTFVCVLATSVLSKRSELKTDASNFFLSSCAFFLVPTPCVMFLFSSLFSSILTAYRLFHSLLLHVAVKKEELTILANFFSLNVMVSPKTPERCLYSLSAIFMRKEYISLSS